MLQSTSWEKQPSKTLSSYREALDRGNSVKETAHKYIRLYNILYIFFYWSGQKYEWQKNNVS